MEHLPFNPGEREDRYVDDSDDEFPEQGRPTHLAGRLKGEGQPFVPGEQATQPALLLRVTPQAVLDDDDGTIDDEAEVERPEAHEIPGDLISGHTGDGEEHRKRDDRRGDEGRAQVTQQNEEREDDEQRALEEIGLDGADGSVDEGRPIIDGLGDDARRQALVDLDQVRRDTGRDLAGILPDEHEDRPHDDLAPILRGGTVTQLATELDLRDLAQAQRHATAHGDDDLADIGDTPELSGNANEILLSIALDIACTDVLVIPGERLHDVLQRDSVGAKLIRPRRHVKLLLEAADGVHLGHAPEVS